MAGGITVDALIGRQLGEFLLEEHLGQGYFGLVFRATQRTLERQAVVKVARSPAASDSAPAVKAFLREAQLASRIDHPYAAHVYAFGLEQDGLLWMAMEFVRGTALDVVLERRRLLGLTETVRLMLQLVEVVHAAHEVGIIHRDLKPANIMVVERAGSVFPKLLDLGVALDISGAATAPNAKGPTGTPLYMAPELWVDPDSAGPQTDIYAMAAIAYELLTGAPAFRGAGIREISAAHAFQLPPRLPPPMPEALSDVLVKGMSKRASDRYPTALAFGAALRDATSVTLVEKGALHIDQQVTDVDGELAYSISGTLSEDFPAPPIPGAATRVRVNLRGVQRINSGGVRAWIHWLGSAPSHVEWVFEECSFPVVQQGTTIANFLPGQVTSYLAPYFCDACGDENLVLVRAPNLPAEHRACAACDEQATLDYPIDALRPLSTGVA